MGMILMSAVLAACMESGIILMSDGRKVKFTSQNNYIVADEDCKKIRVINDICIKDWQFYLRIV
jgi:hypothetical protein